MSKKNQLRFETLGISAFAGIGPKTKVQIEYPEGFTIAEEIKNVNKDNGVVIVFPEGYNYIKIEGDQGVGKTSLIECLKEAAGGLAASNTENVSKNEEGEIIVDKRYNNRFWGTDGGLYNLRVTKSTITLEEISVDAEGKPILNAKNKEQASIKKTPKSLLQQIIGPGGISPMALKTMNGADQIKWVKSLFNPDVETEKMEIEIRTKYDKAYSDRTKANNEYKRLNNILEADPFFKEYEKWQKYFDVTNAEDLQKAIESVTANKQQYDIRVNGVPQLELQVDPLKKDIQDIEEEIKKLQLKKEEKEERLKTINQKIDEGKLYLQVNKKFVTDYEEMADKIKEASEFSANKQSFDLMVKTKKAVDDQADLKIKLDAQVDELDKLKKEYVKKFTPDIPDFEVCIKDEGSTREGLFYKGRTLGMLAESELWELATQLWKAMNVKVIYVENINSLGSAAIDKFNEFLTTDGAYIFATQMNRGDDNLKISFNNKIPK